MLTLTEVESPLGPITLAAKRDTLAVLVFSDGWPRLRETLVRRMGALALTEGPVEPFASRVKAYFAGELDALEELPVEVDGTPFQRRVWAELRNIPRGEVISYSELARRVGAPDAVRAVGSANGANPVSLVIPCHRVIQKDGSLGGYGGGLHRKKWLLAHERPSAVEGERGVADDRSVLFVDRLLVMKQLPLCS
jgi:methylated-DNA-[protein]-cysteine S-methyltransferase